MANQPEWELIYSTDYSALYRDRTGAYEPELAIAQVDDDTGHAHVYRFPLERCKWIHVGGTKILVKGHYQPTHSHAASQYQPWFVRDLQAIASSCGYDVEELCEWLCSDDPKALAGAYEAIGGYYGFANFDQYPEEWTVREFADWPEKGPKMAITLSQSDDDDGMVTVYCDDKAAAEHDQSIDGSNWECPSDMDVAYASIVDRPTLVAELEKEGYEVDDSEYSAPDEEDMARWRAKYEAELAK